MNDSTTSAAIGAESEPIDPRVRVGHVHLKVADLERSLAFYCGVLGFGVHGLLGHEAAFLAAGSYHHHLAINTWESRGGSPPPKGSTGLHHVAFVYPTRAALGRALRRLRAAAVPLTGASDHGGTEAIYLCDPDGNGVELYWDRPEQEWPRNPDGSLMIVSKPLDVENLAAEGYEAGASVTGPAASDRNRTVPRSARRPARSATRSRPASA